MSILPETLPQGNLGNISPIVALLAVFPSKCYRFNLFHRAHGVVDSISGQAVGYVVSGPL
jgi:hypothetical protein